MKRIGLICMAKKAESQPMQELIKRLVNFDIEVVIFKEKMILEQPIEKWPQLEVVIAFHSSGYPINKVIEYVRQRRCCINGELQKQRLLFLRSIMKDLLHTHNIPQPEYVVIHRRREFCKFCLQGYADFLKIYGNSMMNYCHCTAQWKAQADHEYYPLRCSNCVFTNPTVNSCVTDDYVESNGKRLSRPFLEKPIDADSHDIFIYFDDCAKILFRKIKDQSSQFVQGKIPIRNDGCYVYEQFIQAQDNKDLKVYSIYPNYTLCELRKAPYVDGIVERDVQTNKEIRTQTELFANERIITTLISKIFSQLICGFDILRTEDGRSLIMDINGFSFVKGNMHYFDYCANILAKMTEREIERRSMLQSGKKIFIDQMYLKQIEDDTGNRQVALTNEYLQKLNQDGHTLKYQDYKDNNVIKRRALVSVFRHADRVPKMKFKFTSNNKDLLSIFVTKSVDQEIDYRIKPQYSTDRAQQIALDLENFIKSSVTSDGGPQTEPQLRKLSTITSSFMQNMQHMSPFPSFNELVTAGDASPFQNISAVENEGIHLMIYLISNGIAGTKIQINSPAIQKGETDFYKAEYIIKWGGYLTIAGLRQAFDSGKQTRARYTNQGQKVDLKIYNTTERRINRTAEGLLLGFLSQLDQSIEDLLPVLNESPFTLSDFICPDIFLLLTEQYGDIKIPGIGYNVSELRLMISSEEQNISHSQNYKDIKLKQHQQNEQFNTYMNDQSTTLVKYQYWDKTNASFKTILKPVLTQLQHAGYYSHYQILIKIEKDFKQLLRFINQQLLTQNSKLNLVSYKNSKYSISDCCMSESFPYLYRQFAFLTDEQSNSYNASKLSDIYDWLTFIIIHHKEFVKIPELLRLHSILSLYAQRYQTINYGVSDYSRKRIGDLIARNLLQNIQDDITSANSFFRSQEINEIQTRVSNIYKSTLQMTNFLTNSGKMYDLEKGRSEENTESTETISKQSSQFAQLDKMSPVQQNAQSPRQATRLNSMISFAQASKKIYYNDSFKEEASSITQEVKQMEDVYQVKFYVTDEAHIFSLYNLMVEGRDEEFLPFSTLLKKKDFDTVNYLAQFHFQYYELFNLKTHQEREDRITEFFMQNQNVKDIPQELKEQGPSRFLEIYYSNGTSNEVFQLCKSNCIPIDVPELVYSLLPFNNIARWSKKLIDDSQIAIQQKYELSTVIGIYRHGDRLPKQKFKVNVKTDFLVDAFIQILELNPQQPKDVSLSYEKNATKLIKFIEQFDNILHKQQHHIKTEEYELLVSLMSLIKVKPPALKFQAKFPTPWQGIKQMTLSGKHGGVLTDIGRAQSKYCAETLFEDIELDCKKSKFPIETLTANALVFTNDEQRVIETATVFTKTIMDKCGLPFDNQVIQELPTLSSINQRARTLMDIEKNLINKALTIDKDFQRDYKELPPDVQQLVTQLDVIQSEDLGNPKEKLIQLKTILDNLIVLYKKQLDEITDQQAFDTLNLSIMLLQNVTDDFASQQNFNVSKIGNIHDLIRYEVLNNSQLSKEILQALKDAYVICKKLINFVGPSEYGTSDVNCDIISSTICQGLLQKIDEVSQSSGLKLFFVSESHIQSLVNVFSKQLLQKGNIKYLVEFMSHLLIKIYRNQSNQTRLEVYFSVGSTQNPFKYEHGIPRISQPILMSDNQTINLLPQLVSNAQKKAEMIKIQFELDWSDFHPPSD